MLESDISRIASGNKAFVPFNLFNLTVSIRELTPDE